MVVSRETLTGKGAAVGLHHHPLVAFADDAELVHLAVIHGQNSGLAWIASGGRRFSKPVGASHSPRQTTPMTQVRIRSRHQCAALDPPGGRLPPTPP
jgi:hypothetical protein